MPDNWVFDFALGTFPGGMCTIIFTCSGMNDYLRGLYTYTTGDSIPVPITSPLPGCSLILPAFFQKQTT